MADTAVIDSSTSQVGSLPLSGADNKLSNGLGLELLMPSPPSAESASKASEESKLNADRKEKPTAERDPKTGRFLPVKVESDLPGNEEAANDEPETLKKRLKDTRDWATKVNQTNQELDRQLKALQAEMGVLKQKFDGTYVEPDKSDVDPVELAKLTERTKISRGIAEQLYGHDEVRRLIFDEGSPYRELEQADPLVKARVFQAEQPVMEAIRQLKWKGFVDKYGQDPDKIVDTIYKEAEAAFVQTLKQKGLKTKTVEDVGGLSAVQGEGGGRDTGVSNSPASVDLSKVFTNFPTGHF